MALARPGSSVGAASTPPPVACARRSPLIRWATTRQCAARNRDQLKRGWHEPWSNGQFWLKPGAHTRDRYLVSVEGWRLLVWRMTDHDEYDNLFERARRGDVGSGIVAERRSHYEPFVRMDLYEQN
jgi:hypothetical protein